jgi:hypothetical protein
MRRTGGEERIAAMSASVSDVNWRRWLQVWNASGIILMAVYPRAVHQCVSLSLSRAGIPESCQKCHHFAAFIGASAKYPGERKGMLTKKREDKREKERFTIHASLCGLLGNLSVPACLRELPIPSNLAERLKDRKAHGLRNELSSCANWLWVCF